jgi:hypothetical protein
VTRIEETYKSELKLPVQKLNEDLEVIKRSYHDLAQVINE